MTGDQQTWRQLTQRAHVGGEVARRPTAYAVVFAAAIIGLALVLGLVVGGAGGRLVVICTFAVIVTGLTIWAPTVAIGLLPAVQAADWVRVQTSVASVSPRTTLIVVMAAARLPVVLSLLRRRLDLRFVAGGLGVWWLLSPVRSSHSVFGESPVRGLVTEGSFVAIALVGATFSGQHSALRSIARGSAGALLILGLASVLASLGWLAEPARTTEGREVFGVQSPFLRNYGFDVPFDAVALLVPLCAPYYVLCALDDRTARRARQEACVVLALLGFAFVMLFQARGMIVQLAIAAVLMSFLIGRRKVALAGAALLVVGVAIVGRTILSVDEISTNIRLRIDAEALSAALGSITAAVTGVDEHSVVRAGLSDPALGEATEGSSIAIHNVFLSSLVTGGVVSFLALAGVVVYAGIRLLRSDFTQSTTKILAVAFALVLIEMNIEPLRANVIGSWLVLGLCLGLEGRRVHSSVTPAGLQRRRARSPA